MKPTNPIIPALIAAIFFMSCQPAHADCDETINAETIEIAGSGDRK